MDSIVFDILIKEAKKSYLYRKHAACILDGKKIVSIGHNYMPKIEFTDKKSIHAEHAAIINLPKKYKIKKYYLTLVVIRINNAGNKLMISKPCINCMNCIEKVNNINKINFSS